ncbi:hypothetical protein ILUMI_14931, partial [Ignelater luminosus]
MESDSDESFSCTPEEIVKAASTATSNLLPEKSRGQYLKEYDLFMKWRAEKQVALIFGIAGALRREELYKMTLEDINDTGTVLIITIPDSKTHIQRRFTVIVEITQKNVNLIEIYRDIKPSGQRTLKVITFSYNFETVIAKPK